MDDNEMAAKLACLDDDVLGMKEVGKQNKRPTEKII